MRRRARLTFLAAPLLLAGCGYQWADHPPHGPAVTSASSSVSGYRPIRASLRPLARRGSWRSVSRAACSASRQVSTVPLVISNVSASGCYLFGYPRVAFIDRDGHPIPFEYQTAGVQVVTSAKPRRVDLAARGVAYVTVNKYRCDLGDLVEATSLRLTPPSERMSLEVGIWGMPYCGPGDPGSVVQVSPIAATQAATLSH